MDSVQDARDVSAVALGFAIWLTSQEESAQAIGQSGSTSQESEASASSSDPTKARADGCRPAILQKSKRPKYPSAAHDAGLEGLVELNVTISEEGGVKEVRVAQGDPSLTRGATDAVRKWRYLPAHSDSSHTAESTANVKVQFKLHPEQVSAESTSGLPACFFTSAVSPLTTAADSMSASQVYNVGGPVTAPRAVYSPAPTYDDEDRRAGVQGAVALKITVSRDGEVKDPKVAKSLNARLDQQAIDSVRTWRFEASHVERSTGRHAPCNSGRFPPYPLILKDVSPMDLVAI